MCGVFCLADDEVAVMRGRLIGVTRVNVALYDSDCAARCVDRLTAMGGRATAWFCGMAGANKKLCGKLRMRVGKVSRVGLGSVVVGGAIGQGLEARRRWAELLGGQ